MKTLLQINTSLFSTDGASSKLADRVVANWQARNPGGRVPDDATATKLWCRR